MQTTSKVTTYNDNGSLLIELCIALAIIALLACVILPAGARLYREVAIEYETHCLLTELRHLQTLSRTTLSIYSAPDVYAVQLKRPFLKLESDGYLLRQEAKTVKQHTCLPSVRFSIQGRQSAARQVIGFDENGLLTGTLLTIEVFANGALGKGNKIIIDQGGRIRVERVSA